MQSESTVHAHNSTTKGCPPEMIHDTEGNHMRLWNRARVCPNGNGRNCPSTEILPFPKGDGAVWMTTPLPQQQATGTPQLRRSQEIERLDVKTQDASRSSEPVGGTDQGWLAEKVEKTRSQYCRLGEPAIANHRTRHDVNNQEVCRIVGF